MVNTTSVVRLGSTTGSLNIVGDVGQFFIWNLPLTSQGISDYYNTGSGVTYQAID